MIKLNFLFILLFCVSTLNCEAQLTGVLPAEGVKGQKIEIEIFSNGLFIQTTAIFGNIARIRFLNGGNSFTAFEYNNPTIFDLEITGSDSLTTTVSIGTFLPPGLYDLEIITGDTLNLSTNQMTYVLPGAFNVLLPDGTITGTAYTDANKNGIKDIGETGISNLLVWMMPGNCFTSTDISGNYSIPVINGNYAHYLRPEFFGTSFPYYYFNTTPDTVFTTINSNNSSGNDFGLKNAIYSITPSIGYHGVTNTFQLLADEPIFNPGGVGNLIGFGISGPTFPYGIGGPTTFNIIDSFTVDVFTNIPVSIPVGTGYDVRVYVTTGFVGSHQLLGQFEIQAPPFYIEGSAFFDQNQNQIKDTGEPGINMAKFKRTPDSTIVFANTSGDFLFGSSGGMQTVTYLNNVPGLSLYTDSISYTTNVTANVSGLDFGFISTEPDYSIRIENFYIFPRCNSDQNVSFIVRNTSNITYDARAWLKFDPQMTFNFSAMPPTLISNDTIYWDVNNLEPYTEVGIIANFAIPGPGTVISINAGSNSLNLSGVVQLSDDKSRTDNIICAWDPNDKQVTPEGILAPHYTLMNENLEYLIRFQNTGNETAFNVVVIDSLDSNLDFNTFEIYGSSHTVQTELKSNGVITFTFNNIMLVDSVTDEPNSHGYIRYRISAKSGLPDGTLVNNTAHIYFDFNPAVITNTTLNTMVYVLPVGLYEESDNDNVIFYPNPFRLNGNLTFSNIEFEKYNLEIYDVTGKIVVPSMSTTENFFIISNDKVSDGIYFYKLINTQSGKIYRGKFICE